MIKVPDGGRYTITGDEVANYTVRTNEGREFNGTIEVSEEAVRSVVSNLYGRNVLQQERDSDDWDEVTARLIASLRSDRNKLNTRESVKMETNSISSWFVEEAHNRYPVEEIGERMADGGFPQVREMVLEGAADEVRSREDDSIRSFNMVTMEWPHDARAYLAAYQYQNESHPSDYEDKIHEFANAVGVLDYETMQSELTWYYDDNPYHDPNLTDAEARAVCILRANDEDESIIEDVDSADNFLGWYRKSGNVDAATRACKFDAAIPEDIAMQLADPDEWGDLSADEIEDAKCVHCSTRFYHVHHHEEGETWLSNAGTVSDEIYGVGPGEPYSSDDDGSMVCRRCHEEFENDSHVLTYYSGSRLYQIGQSRSVQVDYGNMDDTHFESADELRPSEHQQMVDLLSGNTTDVIMLRQTDSASAPIEHQEELMADMVGHLDEIFDTGPIYIRERPHFSGAEHHIFVPTDAPKAVREVKLALDNADEIVQTETEEESEEGLGELFA